MSLRRIIQQGPLQIGRPRGVRTHEAEPARAFGAAVRELREQQGIAQDVLASLASIDRSHMGKIERGTHLPTLGLVLKIAKALNLSSAVLMTETERRLQADSALTEGPST